MESIALKLQLLNCPTEMYERAYKHAISLNFITIEELKQILSFLVEKGLVPNDETSIKMEPISFTIFLNSLDTLKQRVAEMEEIGELDIYKEKLVRLNYKGIKERINILNSKNIPYKENGKYAKFIFHKKMFDEKVSSAESLENEPEFLLSDIATVGGSVSMAATSDNAIATQYTGSEVSGLKSPLEEILKGPQTIGLNDKTFARYERLSDCLRKVINEVYGINEINDTITDNLIKLITNEIMDDAMVMYYAVTYGKNISDDEAKKIKKAIKDKLEYMGIMDIDLGGMA